MTGASHVVGLQELRRQTSAVILRVRQGETIDVTDHGRLVARISPVDVSTPPPALQLMIEVGRAHSATRPGFRPRMHAAGGTDRVSDALAEVRGAERW